MSAAEGGHLPIPKGEFTERLQPTNASTGEQVGHVFVGMLENVETRSFALKIEAP